MNNENKKIETTNQKQFKYPIGKCKSEHIKGNPNNDVEFIGYSFFNVQVIDTRLNTVRPTGEREKVLTCLDCYLYEKPMMEDRIAEEKMRNPSIIPYKWFWFYNKEDEKKYHDNWKKRYEKHLAKQKILDKYKGKKDNITIKDTLEWQEKFKDCLAWDEKKQPKPNKDTNLRILDPVKISLTSKEENDEQRG